MDEFAKCEARNYLSAAGFFLIGAIALLSLLLNFTNTELSYFNWILYLVIGNALLVVATLLFILRKRDMIAILFALLGFLEIIYALTSQGLWSTIITIFLLIAAIITITGKDKKKWLLFLILFLFLLSTINEFNSYDKTVNIVFSAALTLFSFYFAFCCSSERFHLPGHKTLTADETLEFKQTGPTLGYLLFAFITGGYACYYIQGEEILPTEIFYNMELTCGILMIYVAVMLLAVGKMRFTPVMFLLMGVTSLLGIFASGWMFIGIGILWILIGLFAILRKEKRILPGIMLVIYGCTGFFSAYASGTVLSAPVVSIILNLLPCLIAIYISFAVYSQSKKIPLF